VTWCARDRWVAWTPNAWSIRLVGGTTIRFLAPRARSGRWGRTSAAKAFLPSPRAMAVVDCDRRRVYERTKDISSWEREGDLEGPWVAHSVEPSVEISMGRTRERVAGVSPQEKLDREGRLQSERCRAREGFTGRASARRASSGRDLLRPVRWDSRSSLRGKMSEANTREGTGCTPRAALSPRDTESTEERERRAQTVRRSDGARRAHP
jgi:hypothetical protein